jgi:hypothetical protein
MTARYAPIRGLGARADRHGAGGWKACRAGITTRVRERVLGFMPREVQIQRGKRNEISARMIHCGVPVGRLRAS